MPLGRLLIGVGQRQHVRFGQTRPGDLQADRHALFRKTAGNRDGRQSVAVECPRVLFGVAARGRRLGAAPRSGLRLPPRSATAAASASALEFYRSSSISAVWRTTGATSTSTFCFWKTSSSTVRRTIAVRASRGCNPRLSSRPASRGTREPCSAHSRRRSPRADSRDRRRLRPQRRREATREGQPHAIPWSSYSIPRSPLRRRAPLRRPDDRKTAPGCRCGTAPQARQYQTNNQAPVCPRYRYPGDRTRRSAGAPSRHLRPYARSGRNGRATRKTALCHAG